MDYGYKLAVKKVNKSDPKIARIGGTTIQSSNDERQVIFLHITTNADPIHNSCLYNGDSTTSQLHFIQSSVSNPQDQEVRKYLKAHTKKIKKKS
jgi:hypothetical protein